MNRLFLILFGCLFFQSFSFCEKEEDIQLIRGMVKEPEGIVSFIKDVVIKEVGVERSALKAGLMEGDYAFVMEFVGSVDKWGRTALHEAVFRGEVEVVRVLVDMGVDVNVRDNKGRTALYELACNVFDIDYSFVRDVPVDLFFGKKMSRVLETVKFLIEKGANVNFVDDRGRTALHEAAARGELEVVRVLVNMGVDVNVRDNDGNTALHILSSDRSLYDWRRQIRAIDTDSFDRRENRLIEWFLKNGVDVNARNNDGDTALHEAAFRGRPGVVKALLEKGMNIDINAQDKEGRTGLHGIMIGHGAANMGTDPNRGVDPGLVKCFIERGADVNARDNKGRTALHEAIRWRRFSEADHLLRAGAYINARDKDGREPFQSKKHQEQFFSLQGKGYEVKEEPDYSSYYYGTAIGAVIGAATYYYFNYVFGLPLPLPLPVPPEA